MGCIGCDKGKKQLRNCDSFHNLLLVGISQDISYLRAFRFQLWEVDIELQCLRESKVKVGQALVPFSRNNIDW